MSKVEVELGSHVFEEKKEISSALNCHAINNADTHLLLPGDLQRQHKTSE